jgi:hypothetical protein
VGRATELARELQEAGGATRGLAVS